MRETINLSPEVRNWFEGLPWYKQVLIIVKAVVLSVPVLVVITMMVVVEIEYEERKQ